MNAPPLHVHDVRAGSDQREVLIELTVADTRRQIFYRSGGAVLSPNPEAGIALALLPAMAMGSPIRMEGPISEQLLANLPTINDILSTWEPSLHKVGVEGATPVSRDANSRPRYGAFFSAGMDSFYTVLRHLQTLDDLVFVHGFDIALDAAAIRAKVSNSIREVGAELGKQVIEIETNFREVLRVIPWGRLGHGAALASIGHLLSPHLTHLYVPATHTYTDLHPWGSHPLLDPLWSTEGLQFLHDGCEATRVEKAAFLAEHDVAMRSLRVCFENPNGSYNCGRCEKCLRTMVNLAAVDALAKCETFDTELDVKRISRIRIDNDSVRSHFLENISALEGRPEHRLLCKALRKAVLMSDRKQPRPPSRRKGRCGR